MIGNYVEIELAADQMYYTIIGEEKDMSTLLSKIKTNEKKYMIAKLCVPLANISPSEYIIDNYMEQIQCSLLCDCNPKEEKRAYALMCIEKDNGKDVLRYLYIDAEENNDPEMLIENEINKLFKENDVAKSIMKSTRLIDIISYDTDTLIYLSRYSRI